MERIGMTTATQDHTEILGAALDSLDEGIAVLDGELHVLFWNGAATAMTGYPSAELLSRPLPTSAYQIDLDSQPTQPIGVQPPGPSGLASVQASAVSGGTTGRPLLVRLRHRHGHTLPAMLRRTPLRDALGARFGTLLRFHPVEEIDAFAHSFGPHGLDADGDRGLQIRGLDSPTGAHTELEERLDAAAHEWQRNGVPFGVLWIKVDQGAMLRKTHGHDASEAMLSIVERTLQRGLHASEALGRWGENEFLTIAHERNAELLKAHGQHLAALAQTAEFRWWGDAVPLTLSIGAAQARAGENLTSLLRRSQESLQASGQGGELR